MGLETCSKLLQFSINVGNVVIFTEFAFCVCLTIWNATSTWTSQGTRLSLQLTFSTKEPLCCRCCKRRHLVCKMRGAKIMQWSYENKNVTKILYLEAVLGGMGCTEPNCGCSLSICIWTSFQVHQGMSAPCNAEILCMGQFQTCWFLQGRSCWTLVYWDAASKTSGTISVNTEL